MSSVLIIQGRRYSKSRPQKHDNPAVLLKNVHGEPVDCSPRPPDVVDDQLRAGIPYKCKDDRVTYLVIQRCDPLQRWASTMFWQQHLRVPHTGLLRLVRAGFVDAAIEVASRVRRYRCRDERKMRKSAAWSKLRHDIEKAEQRHRDAEELRGVAGYRNYKLRTR